MIFKYGWLLMPRYPNISFCFNIGSGLCDKLKFLSTVLNVALKLIARALTGIVIWETYSLFLETCLKKLFNDYTRFIPIELKTFVMNRPPVSVTDSQLGHNLHATYLGNGGGIFFYIVNDR